MQHKKADPFYLSSTWRSLRKVILKRDNYTCQSCGVRRTDLHVDHFLSRKEHPALALTPSNLRCLCSSCHAKAYTSFARDARGLKQRPKINKDGFPEGWT
jgi:5-methylcytosine-specific restriction endonuclease McrA